MEINHAAFDKTDIIAFRMYCADCQLNSLMPVEWDILDDEIKFDWLYIAASAIREMAILEPFQRDAVVEAYRTRKLFPVADGETYESNMANFFAYGWNTAFFQFDAPTVPLNTNAQ